MRYHAPAIMSTEPKKAPQSVIVWLAVVLIMTAAIVLVGGLTRLTDSGLSITEWKPVTGVIPPLSEADWQEELQKYRSTTEYQQQNKGMSLAEFKPIYWWEWGHRMLARAIGLAVLLPLLWFSFTGTLKGQALRRGWGLFGLVCAQGALGWFMVVSGLVGRLDVSQYRLAAHLTLAFIIFGWTLWMLLDARHPHKASGRAAGLALAWVVVAAVLVQIVFGGLVAGLDAGLIYTTWPLMDGAWAPQGLFLHEPWWINFGDNVTMVQFQHRMMAYLVAVVVLVAAVASWPKGAQSAFALVFVTSAQVVLGVLTLLAGSDGVQPVGLGAAHQLGALALFGAAIWHLHVLKRPTMTESSLPHVRRTASHRPQSGQNTTRREAGRVLPQ